jgi:ABC-type transport system involved in cytochrome c biogenesis permease subunit
MTSESIRPNETAQAETLLSVVKAMRRQAEIIFRPVASLRLTVALFAMSVFLVFVGTLAQVNESMWEVIDNYFHSFFVWIRFQVFFPISWFPTYQDVPGGIPFPGGLAIGFALLTNLLAAHLVRFRMQAKGNRLKGGLAFIALGIVLTYLVIAGGNSSQGFQGEPSFGWQNLWIGFIGFLGVCSVALIATLVVVFPRRHDQPLEFWAVAVGSSLISALSIALAFNSDSLYLGDSGMRILWQLIQGGLAGIVLLIGCMLVFRRRGGIVLIHSGVGLMMLGELLVGTFAVEQQVAIREGQTVNYAYDIRSTELAIVVDQNEQGDDAVVVPMWTKGSVSRFLNEGSVEDGKLPFDIEIVHYFRNTELIDVDPRKKQPRNPANSGFGMQVIAVGKRPTSGADSSSEQDVASTYVKLKEKGGGREIGTYLLVQEEVFNQPLIEEIRYKGTSYALSLRFHRIYKPYQIRLDDVVQETYVGTNTPRHFASAINIVDPERGIDRDSTVWMNNPVRFAGETFYQTNYSKRQSTVPGGRDIEITTLSVVENTGWMIPYVSCMLVAIGMMYHFSLALSRFLKRLLREPVKSDEDDLPAKSADADDGIGYRTPVAPANIARWLPIAIVVLFAGYAASKARIPSVGDGELDLYQFSCLPIVYEGRVQPYDTLARNTLKVISGRETYKDSDGQTQPAIKWLLDVASDPDSEESKNHPIFKIDHPEIVMNLFALQRRKGGRYSFAELEPKLESFQDQVRQARERPAAELISYQKKVLELSKKIFLFVQIRDSHFRPPLDAGSDLVQATNLLLALEQFQNQDVPLVVRNTRNATGWVSFATAHAEQFVQQLAARLKVDSVEQLANRLARANVSDEVVIRDFYRRQGMPVPPDNEIKAVLQRMPDDVRQTLNTMKEAEITQVQQMVQTAIDGILGPDGLSATANPYATSLNEALLAYQSQNSAAFSAAIVECQRQLASGDETAVSTTSVRFESFFNNYAPFIICFVLYIIAFVLIVISWVYWTKTLNRAAFWLMIFTVGLHTAALISRIYISGRPPVTNLYSSAVFIGWACVIAGLVLEKVFALGIGNVISAVAGIATLQVAHNLSGDGDTFTVLQAVLDTTFWLSTHVVCITLGYATTFVAGGLGLIFVIRGVLTPSLTKGVRQHLARMIYGMTCFALFFSFVGTVLGGLWADDSWGRFWGWDPKENGALIIVLWNALILHARWGKVIGDRGLAALAVVGNIVTTWSWFGVNELGVGLHSYGFTEGVLVKLGLVVVSQLAIIGLALIPYHKWRSVQAESDSK